jgi:hypothetical protein
LLATCHGAVVGFFIVALKVAGNSGLSEKRVDLAGGIKAFVGAES